MARLWSCGFEENSQVANTNGAAEVSIQNSGSSPTIVTSPVRSGTYSHNFTGFTGTTAQAAYYQVTASTSNQTYARIYLYIGAYPNADTAIFGVGSSSASLSVQMALTSTGTLKAQTTFGGLATIGSPSSVLSLSTWYRLEMFYDNTVASGFRTFTCRIDGTNFATTNTAVGNALGSLFLLWGRFATATGTTGNWTFDDVAVNDDSGSFQNSWPADGKIIHLRPNATGDVNTYATAVGGTAGAANNYTRVSEVTPDTTTTFNQATALNQEDLFNITDSGIGLSDTVNIVSIGLVAANSTAGASATTAVKAEIEKTSSSTISQGAAFIPNSTNFFWHTKTAPFIYQLNAYQDPTGSDWSQTTLDSMQIGYKETAFATTHTRVTAVWALVDYTPNSAPTPVSPSTSMPWIPPFLR